MSLERAQFQYLYLGLSPLHNQIKPLIRKEAPKCAKLFLRKFKA